jgi:5S rRNA maturation endonuclease (ribonuclease M5)
MFTTRKTFFEATRMIDSYSTEISISGLLDDILKEEPEYKPFDELMIRRLHQQAIESPRAMRYYEGRRISLDSVNKFSLGYSENQDMVTIPMTSPDGKIFVGFVARSVEGKEFKNTPKLPKSKILFNLHRARKYDTVYVVESSFDAIRLDQNGVAAVATLGANVSRTQTDLLTKHFNDVIVIADNDDAGKEMQQKILDRLGHRVTLIGLPDRFKDIGDMQDSDIKQLTKRVSDPLLNYI